LLFNCSEILEYKAKEAQWATREKEYSRKSSKSAYYQEEFDKATTQISILEAKLQKQALEKAEMEREIQDLHHNMQHRVSPAPGTSDKDPRRRMSVRSAAIVSKGNEVVESFEDVVEDLYDRCVK
jgi:hypothetical protein